MNLNLEQKKLITAKPGGRVLVRGVAGSGKTTVAIHRAEFLLNNYCIDEDDRVLVVTFNKTLVKYLRYLHEKMNQDGDSSYGNLFGASSAQVDIHTIDSLVYKYYSRYLDKSKRLKVLYENNKKYAVLKQCIAELAKQFSVNVLDPKNASFLLDEIDWIRSCNYMELSEYQNADRLGRQRAGEGPQRLAKNSETRQAIHALMQAFDERLAQEGLIDPRIMGLEVLKSAQAKPQPAYTHIIVDESQDLTRVQLEFLQTLYKSGDYSSFLFVADTAQSIYPHSWLVRGRSFTSIGMDMTGKSNILSKNYRTTTQIAQAAYSLIDKDTEIIDDEYYVKPSLIDKQGQFPVYKRFKSAQAEAAYVIAEIRKLLGTYAPGEIIVIARLNRQLEMMEECLNEAGLACKLLKTKEVSFDDDCIKLLTMHSIKGLEFKVVFIIGINDDVLPYCSYTDPADDVQELTERKLFYVGMTRASERLYMSSSAKPSRFMGAIAPEYLRINGTSQFSQLYNIRPDEYQCTDKILDLFSKEEKVRQWLLRELQEKYGYPTALLDVEYKVNGFSRVGSVDICVQVNRDGKLVPYIFCEVKAPGTGIEQGLDQLKSYMSNAKHCQYGLATDGSELLIIDADFGQVEDIPSFRHMMLPSSMERFTYHCYRRGRKLSLQRDYNLSQELIVNSELGNEVLSGDKLQVVPTYQGIAAGQPIYMQGKSEAKFYLPTEWFKGRGREHCYLLQVKGDSMQGAGIDDGDHVLVQKQDAAENRDIVAVAMDDEATLKRYVRMGDSVLLIPENPKYEPIQLRDNQARIIGVVIGVLRKEVGLDYAGGS